MHHASLLVLFLINKLNETTNKINDNICDILKGPNIRLSILNPSISILASEYSIMYSNVISPLYFLFFDFINRIINIINVHMDS